MRSGGRPRQHAKEGLRGARPLRTGVTGIHVGEDIGGNQIAQPRAGRVAGAELFTTFRKESGIAERAADITELAVGLGWIDLPPIDVEQLLVRNSRRIVNDFDRFPVFRPL